MTPISYDKYIGQKINYLTIMPKVKTITSPSGRKRKHFLCKCHCGKKKYIDQYRIISNHTKSCGCMMSGKKKHFRTKTREFSIWQGMFDRCYYKTAQSYRFYGAKGIRVCKRWDDFNKFLADMGECPPGYSIERINPRGNYTPKNCKWIHLNQQQKNRTNSIRVRYGRKEYDLYELEKFTGIVWQTLYNRIFKYKWTVDKAILTPARKYTRASRNLGRHQSADFGSHTRGESVP